MADPPTTSESISTGNSIYISHPEIAAGFRQEIFNIQYSTFILTVHLKLFPSKHEATKMDTIKQGTGTSTQHTEEQKRQIYSNLTAEEKQRQSYSEWVKEAYNDQYEKWMPWIEDQYLKWFGSGDNKASYATKGIPP
jgi:hypothetical protein